MMNSFIIYSILNSCISGIADHIRMNCVSVDMKYRVGREFNYMHVLILGTPCMFKNGFIRLIDIGNTTRPLCARVPAGNFWFHPNHVISVVWK